MKILGFCRKVGDKCPDQPCSGADSHTEYLTKNKISSIILAYPSMKKERLD